MVGCRQATQPTLHAVRQQRSPVGADSRGPGQNRAAVATLRRRANPANYQLGESHGARPRASQSPPSPPTAHHFRRATGYPICGAPLESHDTTKPGVALCHARVDSSAMHAAQRVAASPPPVAHLRLADRRHCWPSENSHRAALGEANSRSLGLPFRVESALPTPRPPPHFAPAIIQPTSRN